MINDQIQNIQSLVADGLQQISKSSAEKKSGTKTGNHAKNKVSIVQDVKKQLIGLQEELGSKEFPKSVKLLERAVKKLSEGGKLTSEKVRTACDMVNSSLETLKQTYIDEGGFKDNVLYATSVESEEQGMSVSFGSEDSDSMSSLDSLNSGNSEPKIIGEKNGDLYAFVNKPSVTTENPVLDNQSNYENITLGNNEKLSPEQLKQNLIDNPDRPRVEVFNLLKDYPDNAIGPLMKGGTSQLLSLETMLAVRSIHCLNKVLSSDFTQDGISKVLINHPLYKAKVNNSWKTLADKFINEKPQNKREAELIAFKFLSFVRTK